MNWEPMPQKLMDALQRLAKAQGLEDPAVIIARKRPIVIRPERWWVK